MIVTSRLSLSAAIGGLLLLAAGASSAGAVETSFSLVSPPGEPLGDGTSRTFTPPDATFTLGGSTSFAALEVETDTESWRVELVAPSGSLLEPGEYDHAQRYPFQDEGRPGLSVVGNGSGCNQVSGGFEIHALSGDRFGNLNVLDATFTHYCAGTTTSLPPLTGVVKVNSPADESLWLLAQNSETVAGQPVILTATSALPQGGLVTFLDDGTPIGTAEMGIDGRARLVTTDIAVGSHSLTADYAGTSSLPIVQLVRDSAASFWFAAAAGHRPGSGTKSFAAPDETVTVSGNAFGARVRVDTGETGGRYDLHIVPRGQKPFRTGDYRNATRGAFFAFDGSRWPAIDFTGNGAGCNNAYGSFAINHIRLDEVGAILQLDADFVHRCESESEPPATGHVHIGPPLTPLVETRTKLLRLPRGTTSGVVTLQAIVVPESGGGTPTGTVIFYEDGFVAGTAAVGLDGMAEASVTLSDGRQRLLAIYSGDDVHALSSSRSRSVSLR